MKYRKLWSVCSLPVLLVAALALAVPAPGQATTFLPDNLDGPCCGQTVANLPTFPVVTLQNKYVCWNNCNASLSGTVLTTFTPSPTAACGIYFNNMKVTNLGGGLVAWTGNLVMTYSRTWVESSVLGAAPDTQVWRFILNGDLKPSTTLIGLYGGNACIIAPCVATFNRFHVQGYIDYALDCATGTWSVAFAVDHDCDEFEHNNPFTCRPGAFHPGRSYTWVGPAAGFVCDNNVPTASGTLACDAFRVNNFALPLSQICQFEQPLLGGGITNAGEYCPCNPAGTQYKIQQFDAGTVCQSSAFSSMVGPWAGLVGKSIGFWTDPAVYPGRETLHIERGHTSYTDTCTPDFMTRPYFIGVQTQGGFSTHKLGVAVGGGITITPVSDRLIDLGDATFPGLMSAPRIGKLSVSDKLIQFNVD